MSIWKDLNRIATALELQTKQQEQTIVVLNKVNDNLGKLVVLLTPEPDITGIGVTESPPVVRPG